MPTFIDLTNQNFNKLFTLQLLPKSGIKRKYLCECECGKIVEVQGNHLVSNHTKSCGCWHEELSTKRIIEVGKSQFGKNNPAYNPNLTQEDRINRRKIFGYKEWSKSILVRDKYICQRCGINGSVNAHHLDGYNWCKEKRLNIDNGITLCIKCHKEFHKIYGKKNNTKLQYESWIKNEITPNN
jgi:hypothetical protein